MEKLIVVTGNIGVGKTSLVELLSACSDWTPIYEPVKENPYLADFYQSMHQWSFHSQIYFLTSRLNNHILLHSLQGVIIQDRSVYEDAEIFAHNLYLQGYIDERDYCTYRNLYQAIVKFLPPPDLVIYLKASVDTLYKRILLRGRDFERTISLEYLVTLNKLYEEWITSFNHCPLLTVPSDDLDFVSEPEHLHLIKEKVNDMLTGKKEVYF